MNAPIVTLTTDWGSRDFFVAMVKGRLCSTVPDVRIVDLSHSQQWNDPATTIGILRHGIPSFPEGTVHIIDVGCERIAAESSQSAAGCVPMLVHSRGQYIVCTDRRLLEQSLDAGCDEAVELSLPENITSYSFLAYDLYCDVVHRLLAGESILQIGNACEPLRRRMQPQAQMDGDTVVAIVSGIDNYGNVNLNISYDDFERIRAGRRFRVKIEWRSGRSEHYEDIVGLSRHYGDVRMGNVLLTVSVTGQLQIAINKGSAVQLLGLGYASRCHFHFE